MSVQYYEGIGRRKESTARVRLMKAQVSSLSMPNQLRSISRAWAIWTLSLLL
jgi:ribosomal protein S9